MQDESGLMKARGAVRVSEALRERCAGVWRSLHEHPFIRELAGGTLPLERFRFYLEQDLLFLPALARAAAIGVSRSADRGTMRHFAEELSLTLGREIEHQQELLQRVIELGAAGGDRPPEPAFATVAYSGHVVQAAARGGPPELMAVVLPCTWSYAEIAAALEKEVADHPVYAAWVRFFAEREYVELIEARRETFDEVAAALPPARLGRLDELFTTSARLERAFWDMAYRLEHWPDQKEVE
jgi:thiaminase/transcriptional activator TenA